MRERTGTVDNERHAITSMRTGFILTLGVLLISYLPTVAQTSPTVPRVKQAILAPKALEVAARTAELPRDAFAPPRLVYERPAPFTALLSALDQRGRNVQRLFPVDGEKTLFVSQTHVTVVQLWSGRMQLGGFARTYRMENVLSGLSDLARVHAFGARAPRDERIYGISLTFHLQRAGAAKSPKISTARFVAVKSQSN